jgi:hypothetical protein
VERAPPYPFLQRRHAQPGQAPLPPPSPCRPWTPPGSRPCAATCSRSAASFCCQLASCGSHAQPGTPSSAAAHAGVIVPCLQRQPASAAFFACCAAHVRCRARAVAAAGRPPGPRRLGPYPAPGKEGGQQAQVQDDAAARGCARGVARLDLGQLSPRRRACRRTAGQARQEDRRVTCKRRRRRQSSAARTVAGVGSTHDRAREMRAAS